MALVISFSLTEVLAGHLTFEMYVALDNALVSKLVYSTLTKWVRRDKWWLI
jgi:hypothetical protein